MAKALVQENETATKSKRVPIKQLPPLEPGKKNSLLSRVARVFLYLILAIVAVFQIYPLIWLFFFSLKNNREIFGESPFAIPTTPNWENYVQVWTQGNIGLYFFNSVWVTAASVIFTALLASFVTFAIPSLISFNAARNPFSTNNRPYSTLGFGH